MQLNGASRREAARRAKEQLGYLEIAHRADSMPANLSGGERHSAVITVTHDHRMIEGFDTVYYLDDGVLSRLPQKQAAAMH